MTSAKIPPTSHSVASRLALIDALKAVASQLIVLHHLSAYGPVAEAAGEAAPGLMAWLYDYARIAVQVFLVVGGFLAARALAPLAEPAFSDPLGLIRRRYQRLAIPYLAALALAVLGAALARRWMVDDAIPAPPGFFQGLAHAFLLQGLLGYDSLSAGVWYVAIDFQLFALMVLVLWAGRHGSTRLGLPAIALVLVLALASLFGFNRDAAWDNWAIYFFGSYGLGAAAWWASARGRLAAWLGVMATIAIAALVVDFRLRIAVALAVALALGFARRGGWLVVDEAFIDTDPEESLLPSAAAPNLIVFRSLGKFFGLAGARVGFIFGAPDLLAALAEKLGPWAVPGPSRAAARLALEDTGWQAAAHRELPRASRRLQELLAPLGPVAATALFASLETEAADALFAFLARRGILVRHFPGQPRLRFGLPGDESQWQRLAAALDEWRQPGGA